MEENRTFRDRYMAGETDFEEIFSLTGKWNFSDDTRTLREFLGLTPEEEDVWISESDEALEDLMEKEKNTRILLVDLDGTLLNDKKEITEKNRRAVDDALARGHKIVITTGRPTVSARRLSRELGLVKDGCFAIAYNGGEIYDLYREKSVYRRTIPLEYVKKVFEEAKKRGLHCQTYNDENILIEKETEEVKRYQKMTNVTAVVVPDVIEALKGREPVKLIVMDYEDHNKLVAFEEETKEWADGKLDRIFSCAAYLEHVAPGVSKGSAMSILCEKLGIPMCNTIAAGDAPNDVSMIEAAAVGVVMQNAPEDIKSCGDYVTEADNNHDGIAEVIERFM